MEEQKIKETQLQKLKFRLRFFKNKYIFTTTFFLIYALFLDENDIFTLITQKSKLTKIETDKEYIKSQLSETRKTVKQLNFSSELERFAREEKLFKKDDEDVFILTYE